MLRAELNDMDCTKRILKVHWIILFISSSSVDNNNGLLDDPKCR